MKKDGLLLGAVLLALMSVLSYAQAPVANRSATSPLLPNSSQSHTTLAGLSPNVQAPILNQLGALTAFDGWSGDNLGGGVAVDGNTAVAAGWGWTWSGSGIAYVFVEPSSGWANMTQTAELTTSDGSAIVSVAISGNTIVGAGVSGISGTAYVFVEPATGWANMTETAKLTTSNGDFLTNAAISGNTVVAAGNSGAAYVFVEPATGWTDMTETAELTTSTGDALGWTAIDGNTVAAGAVWGGSDNGAAYVFVKPAGGWTNMTQTAELTASDGAYDDFLGCGVGVSGDTVAAGAPNHTVNGNGWQGAVYVFVEPTGGWTNMTQTAELTASDGGFTDQLGNSAAISGDTVVGGAPQYEPFGNTGNGKVYAFFQPPGGWTNMTESVRFEASDGQECDALGFNVAVSNGTAMAGALDRCALGAKPETPGAAYVFSACSFDDGLALCPGFLTFGTQLVDTNSSPLAVTLTNSGNSPLKIRKITTSNANFSQTNNCPSKLPVNGQCAINVTFDPEKIKKVEGTLTIKDNAPNSPQTVALSGVGTAVTLLPSNLDFGDQQKGTTSPPQVVTLTNYGTQAVEIYGIRIKGKNSDDFAQSNNCGTSVPAQGNCTINVTFTPKHKGASSATLDVDDNGGGSPQTASLSGNGT